MLYFCLEFLVKADDPTVHEHIWFFLISSHIFMLFLVLPMYMIFGIQQRIFNIVPLHIQMFVTVLIYIHAALAYWLIILPGSWEDLFLHHKFWEGSLTRISIVGVAIVSFLSGYGTTNLPASLLIQYVLIKKQITLENDSTTLQLRINHTQDLLEQKKKQYEWVLKEEERKAKEKKSMVANFFTLFKFSTSSTMQMKSEIEGLELLHESLVQKQNEVKQIQINLKEKNTLRGKIKIAIGWSMGFYAIVRFCLSLYNVIFWKSRAENNEPMFDFIFNLFGSITGLKSLSNPAFIQKFSFIVMTLIILSSIRTLMLQLVLLFKYFFKSISADSVLAITAELTGMYSISYILLIMSWLPRAQLTSLENVIGDVHHQFFFNYYDAIYILSTIICLTTHLVQFKSRPHLD
mmetsp:Transcript_12903/g.19435  ORF Transcript_12903/g.19435 Transcript_12903/m.19435 type:complete len:405 (+) Transcript_12903:235-1449(+)